MKKLSRVVLRSAHRVLNAQEMKSVVGGQVIDDNCREISGKVIDDNCREISGSGGLYPVDPFTHTVYEDVVCGGRCPQMAIDSGGINQFPQTCKKVYEKGADANRMLVLCRCE